MIYFDYASTTPLNQDVYNSYIDVLNKYFYNSEGLYPSAVKVNDLMNKARKELADLLGVHLSEIIFTSGGSEANNTAIKGVTIKNMGKGKHIITSCIEHSSVLNSCKWLEENFGFEITYLPVNEMGTINLSDLEKAIRDDTILVSIMYINNEVGSINPINEIKKIVRKHHNTYLHVDCVQALGKEKIDLTDIDLASFSAHKIYGLKGSGFLIKKDHVQLVPLISGGQQENHLRGGTANAPANIVLGKTLRLALQDFDEKHHKVDLLHAYFVSELEKVEGIIINSPKNGSKYVVNFSNNHLASQVLLNALAYEGYCVSAQSTCDSNDAYSKVVYEMYKDKKRASSTIRVSLSHLNNIEEIDMFIKDLKEIFKQYA